MKNKKIVLAASVILIALIFKSFDSHTQQLPGFYKTYVEALAASEKENIPLMIDFYTSWCKPCKKLDKEVYGHSDFTPYTKSMACVKVNFETEEGKKIGEKYNVKSFPTVVFLDSEGKEIERITSYFAKDRYMSDVTRIIEGKNTVGQMAAKFPNKISYGELFHLSYYYARRNYNKDKRELYYNALINLDSKFEKDSTVMLTNLLFQVQLRSKDYSNLANADQFILKYPKPIDQVELAVRIIKAYIANNQKNKAQIFYDNFIPLYDPKGIKYAIGHLKSMKKMLK